MELNTLIALRSAFPLQCLPFLLSRASVTVGWLGIEAAGCIWN